MDRIYPPLASDIKVRISARAKRACLKVSAAGMVEVVVPKGFKPSLVAEFVAHHQSWLEKTLARMKLARDPSLDTHRPTQIHLRAVDEIWQVNYGLRNKAGISEYRKPHNDTQLWVWTPNEAEQAAPLLRQWLRGRAKSTLQSWLNEVSAETGMAYKKLTVKAQKTRWGSCSGRKHINLNRALMFLPADVVRYLMIHELAHTVHLNHSRAFWTLVASWAKLV